MHKKPYKERCTFDRGFHHAAKCLFFRGKGMEMHTEKASVKWVCSLFEIVIQRYMNGKPYQKRCTFNSGICYPEMCSTFTRKSIEMYIEKCPLNRSICCL